MVASAPAELITGGVISCTVMVWLTVFDSLPQASVAFYVLVLLYVPGQAGTVTSDISVMIGFGSQRSLAVGAVNTGVPGQSMVASAPAALMSGGVISCTVMVWLTVFDSLPQASVAFHVLVLLYVPGQAGTVTSDISVMTGLGSQRSLAVGAVNTGVEGQSMVASAPAALMTGGVISCTVIV